MSGSKPGREGQASDATRYDDVAVLIPCFNEEKTVGKVVTDFTGALTGAKILVFDNESTDNTAAVAQMNGATVIHAPRRTRVLKR
jgi:glycosyltransferase involved in cell wall biosynthesis